MCHKGPWCPVVCTLDSWHHKPYPSWPASLKLQLPPRVQVYSAVSPTAPAPIHHSCLIASRKRTQRTTRQEQRNRRKQRSSFRLSGRQTADNQRRSGRGNKQVQYHIMADEHGSCAARHALIDTAAGTQHGSTAAATQFWGNKHSTGQGTGPTQHCETTMQSQGFCSLHLTVVSDGGGLLHSLIMCSWQNERAAGVAVQGLCRWHQLDHDG